MRLNDNSRNEAKMYLKTKVVIRDLHNEAEKCLKRKDIFLLNAADYAPFARNCAQNQLEMSKDSAICAHRSKHPRSRIRASQRQVVGYMSMGKASAPAPGPPLDRTP